MSTSIDLKIFVRIQLQLIWLYMVFKMLEIISNTRVVNGHGPNSVKKGTIFESRTDYVIAQDVSDFRRWAIKIPRFDTDHRAIGAEITFGKLYIHHDYVTCRHSLPRFPFQRPLNRQALVQWTETVGGDSVASLHLL